MYIDMDTPGCHTYRVFEDGKEHPCGMVVAVDTDEGYVLEYRQHVISTHDKMQFQLTVLPSGRTSPRVFKRYGKFRLEKR